MHRVDGAFRKKKKRRKNFKNEILTRETRKAIKQDKGKNC